jgi:glutamate/tyrosine decarboxylase-like PLP-dependent enzyme
MPNHTLSHWTDDQLERFLRLRQELFLDPLGSNRKRFEEAAVLLQRALFAWYFSRPGEFPGLLSLVQQSAAETRQLRKEELLSMQERRFSLNWPAPEIPAIEGGVSDNQWQKIFGSFNTGYGAQRLFERFLTDLDEYTNPSLRINHRYLGELLPHDNMVSYFAATAATFLNENAVIGKVSPCVTHMEQAAIMRLAELIGWAGNLEIDDSQESRGQPTLPLQRLWTPYPPSQNSDIFEGEQPTGTIVGDGTIANISALLIARNATFNYLLGWGEASQSLGPDLAWMIIREVYGYERMVVITSKGAHYSVTKACHIAGVSPLDVIEVAGYKNPWILDGAALENTLKEIEGIKALQNGTRTCLLLAVVLIAGKTETGYIDEIEDVAKVLEEHKHYELDEVDRRQSRPVVAGKKVDDGKFYIDEQIEKLARERLSDASYQDLRAFRKKMLMNSYAGARKNSGKVGRRLKTQVRNASYNRPFLHVDAAHGGAFLAVPYLRNNQFKGIHLADTVTLDGHKMFYCYYPCGGLLIRTTRWARTLHAGHSSYISEEANHEAYAEDRSYLGTLRAHGGKEGTDASEIPLIFPELKMGRKEMMGLAAIRNHNSRPAPSARSELQHQPFIASLEGSRGCQGIMQMYFNLSTIGFLGYELLLGWTYLLSRRCEEAISLGRVYVRPVTDEELPTKKWMGNAKDWAIQDWALSPEDAGDSPLETKSSKQTSRFEPQRIVPVFEGRLLRLSDGSCNQILVTYIPQNIAKLISSQGSGYWKRKSDDKENAKPGSTQFWQTMHFLWRLNEHLWFKYLYANPAFTYYVGHTEFVPILPNKESKQAKQGLEELLCDWNVWARWESELEDKTGVRKEKKKEKGDQEKSWKCPFFEVLAEEVQSSRENYSTDTGVNRYTEGLVRFFAHKIVIMHPYTDESILSDLLGKMMFWGERSAEAVQAADASCQDWLDRK